MRKYEVNQFDDIYFKNLDIQNRTIWFTPWQPIEALNTDVDTSWEVNDYTVQNAIKGLAILESISKEPINIVWSSYGGDWDAGIAFYDFIRTLESHVTMTCYGRVRSMGTIILQACDERVLAEHCYFMVHYGSAAFETTHAKDFSRFADELERTNKAMEHIYLDKIKIKHPKFTLEKLQDILKI